MLWHELKWPDVAAVDKNLVVVVPLGSLEQHGRHLPVLVDSIQVSEIAQRAEAVLSKEILLLPTLWLGSSDHHLEFPGTVSVRPSLYTAMIKDVVRSILRAGFVRIFLFNGHGGNTTPASQALTELALESDVADAASLAFSSWWELGRVALSPERHGLQTSGVSHACEYETSMMLQIRPDLVKQDAAVEGEPAIASEWLSSGRVRHFHRFHRLTSSGSLGRPSLGTAAKGKSMLDAVVGETVTFLREFAKWPLLGKGDLQR